MVTNYGFKNHAVYKKKKKENTTGKKQVDKFLFVLSHFRVSNTDNRFWRAMVLRNNRVSYLFGRFSQVVRTEMSFNLLVSRTTLCFEINIANHSLGDTFGVLCMRTQMEPAHVK